jgi:molybdopterin-containing oxidoreductase family iron-sulfur binding subunit
MAIDLDKCTGCQACVVACQVENNLPVQGLREARERRLIQWIYILTFTEGEYPYVRTRYIPVLCQHCDNPPCCKVCPVGATYKNEEGIVGQIYPRCIGCRYCANNCPYTIKTFNWRNPNWPGKMSLGLNPDVSVREKGVVEKCTFCHQRLQHARERARVEGRELREGDYTPACVEACPAGAMVFGDLKNPHSQVSEFARSPRAMRLLEDLGTQPKVIYLMEG